MKILFHVISLRTRGGAERALLNLARELTHRGHEVTISIRGRKYAEDHAYEIPQGVRLVWLNKKKRKYSIWRILKMREMDHQRNLRKHLKNNTYDIVVGWLRQSAADVGWLPRRVKPTRVAALRNRPYERLQSPPDRHESKSLLLFRHFGFGRADRIFVQMPQFIDMLPAAWRTRCRVISNPVPLPADAEPAYATREKLIIAVARLTKVKRLDDLVTGFAKFHSSFPDWRLEIWGPDVKGPEINPSSRSNLEALIEKFGLHDSVGLMGKTDQIADVYARARIVAHPSFAEGMSNAVTEAMSRALPVVASGDCIGMSNLIHDGETGLLLPGAGHALPLSDQIADALAKLAADPETAEQLGQNARAWVSEHFSPEHIYDLWENELLEASRIRT